MATWKKVIVSGSDAALANLSVDNAITADLTGTATTASYVEFANVDGLTSFSASVASNLSDTAFDLTIAADSGTANKVLDGETFTLAGGSNITTTVNDNFITASLNANIELTSVTASLKGNVVGNVTGNLTGTATTASYVEAANIDGKVATATLADTASYVAGANVDGAVDLATLATTADTASFVNARFVEFVGGNGQQLQEVSASLATRATNAANANYSASFVGTSGQTGVVFSTTGTGLNTVISATVPNLGSDDNVTFATASITQNLSVGGNISAVGDLSVANATVTGNLTVQGTTTSLETTNLNVEDKFILVNSGSAAADGGIVVNGAGAAIGWDQSAGRWALDYAGATWDQSTIDQDAFVAAVVTSADANYAKAGNIRVDTVAGDIYIYV